MLCYRDRTFCSAKCEKQGTCISSEQYATKEKDNLQEGFVKSLPLATGDYSKHCKEYEESNE